MSRVQPQTQTTANRFDWLWPKISDATTARDVSRYGVGAALFVAAVTGSLAATSMILGASVFGVDAGAFVDAAIFLLVAWRIHHHSRFAAVLGLALYLVERAYMWSIGGPSSPFMAVLITMAFVNSVRGAFAYHRFSEQLAPTTTLPKTSLEAPPSANRLDS